MSEYSITKLEELAINAFPALLTELYNGWILRFSKGYTYRGNSVNPLYNRNKNQGKSIDYCEAAFTYWYRVKYKEDMDRVVD